MEWINWAGNQAAPKAKVVQPANLEELRTLVTSTDDKIRVVGAGHSFTPIVPTDGVIVNLDNMGGVVSTDLTHRTARVSAGGRLYDLSPELEQHGLAFRNLGDINVQSFAGAASTATHGTGQTFGCLASEIQSVRLLTANGEIIEASLSSDPDLVYATQVSLGLLGIILEADVALQPVYKLHRRTWIEPIEQIIEAANERWNDHRNYEFFYIPFSGYGLNIVHDETDADETARLPSTDEADLATLRSVRNWLSWSRRLRRMVLGSALKKTLPEDVIGMSWRMLASERKTRFTEMEYHLPPEPALGVLKKLIKGVERKRSDVFFPIEVRKTAGDQAWLSPFQGGARVSIAVHALAKDQNDWFYDIAEPLFGTHDGRPHWGKLHSLTQKDCRTLYPDFEKFLSLRRQLDPEGRFLTPALEQIFGDHP